GIAWISAVAFMGLEVKGLTWYRAALTAAYHAGVRPPRDRCDRTRPVPHIRLIDPIGGINLVRNDGAVIDQTQGHGTGDHGSTHRWAALSRGGPPTETFESEVPPRMPEQDLEAEPGEGQLVPPGDD